jgi:lysophospholipid acyltransferase (LPLAT)-like uncharacterized protein
MAPPSVPSRAARPNDTPLRVIVGVLLGVIVWCWLRTLRLRVVDRTSARDRAGEAPWVLCFWHGSQVPLLAWRRRRKTTVMVSLSADGALQARVMAIAGMDVVRGSTSRGGVRALAAIVRRLRGDAGTARDAAFAVDGPRGPRHSVAPGAIGCARAVDGKLVPIGGAARPTKVLVRSWDRLALPWPFARAVVVLGPALDANTEGDALGAAIEAADAAAAELLANPDSPAIFG